MLSRHRTAPIMIAIAGLAQASAAGAAAGRLPRRRGRWGCRACCLTDRLGPKRDNRAQNQHRPGHPHPPHQRIHQDAKPHRAVGQVLTGNHVEVFHRPAPDRRPGGSHIESGVKGALGIHRGQEPSVPINLQRGDELGAVGLGTGGGTDVFELVTGDVNPLARRQYHISLYAKEGSSQHAQRLP